MSPEIQHILYATDLSANSTHAMRYASKIARQNTARMTILHVVEAPSPTTYALLSSFLEYNEMKAKRAEQIAYHIEQIRKRLDQLCEKECRYDPELVERVKKIEVREGFAAEEILKEARDGNCDLIVLGTHGKGALENTFVGSVARRVLRRTRRPVLVVPLPKNSKNATHGEEDGI
jgi:nucleotide-binding universal stress UspA family protein